VARPWFPSWQHHLAGSSDRVHRDRLADPVEEVLDGRLGHAVQQHPVDRPPDRAQRRAVAGADGELGPVIPERADLQVGLQAGQQPPPPSGSQVSGSEVIEGKRTGLPSRSATRLPIRAPSGPTPTSASRSSPRRWASPASVDSHSAGEPSSTSSTLPGGSGSSR
jgi:hypothetical protein